jgi:hypothetical protein
VVIEEVDERTSRWERHAPTFRVFVFAGGEPGGSWATSTYDVREADMLDVVRWAQERAGRDGLYAVALLVVDGRGDPGLVWLVGMDANDADAPSRPEFAGMLARRGREVVVDR